MTENKIVGLDIGTSVIRVAIGEIDPETQKMVITGTAQKKSAGLRNGVIVNIEDAKKLSETMIKIGNKFGKEVVALITNMDYPLGYTIGNAIEVKEAIETLDGNG